MLSAYVPTIYFVISNNQLNHTYVSSRKCNYCISLRNYLKCSKIHAASDKTGECVSNDENGLPMWEDSSESVQKQLRFYGPDPPETVFRKPIRPLGFWGKKMAPDMRFMGMDRAAVVRNMKKKYLNILYCNVRKIYKRYVKDALSLEEVLYWKYKLDSLPKESSPVRFRRRCIITGRSRGVIGIFGMCRHKVREFLAKGLIPGVSGASW